MRGLFRIEVDPERWPRKLQEAGFLGEARAGRAGEEGDGMAKRLASQDGIWRIPRHT